MHLFCLRGKNFTGLFSKNLVKPGSILIILLAYRYLNEFATKRRQNYPPLLMGVFAPPYETQQFCSNHCDLSREVVISSIY